MRDGSLALRAPLEIPVSIAFDGAGHLYIADMAANRVLRVDRSSGLITTIAGTGEPGYGGDGGPASQARVQAPQAVAVDKQGHLYIADTFNHRIRRVDGLSGLITTVAGIDAGLDRWGRQVGGYAGDGGPASKAQLNGPSGVAVDAQGHLYIADTGNNRIRRIDGATGLITTYVGVDQGGYFSGDGKLATLARLNVPVGLAVDGAGHLYIADSRNHRIRRVDRDTGLISTVAGTGWRGFAGDGGPAIQAQLNEPQSVAVDEAGHLYIADSRNHRIRRVDRDTGLIATVAGDEADISYDQWGNQLGGDSPDGEPATQTYFRNPQAVLVDGAGHLYIADSYDQRIRKADKDTGLITTVAGVGRDYWGDGGPATQARLKNPAGLAAHGAGHLYIADSSDQRIRRIDGITSLISTVAGNGLKGDGGDGGPATRARLHSPQGLALDNNGHLYFADLENRRIRRVDRTTGLVSTVAGSAKEIVLNQWGEPIGGFAGDGGPATQAELLHPSDVAVDGAGHLYIADSGNNRIRRVDGDTGIITTVAGNGESGLAGDGGPATQAQLREPIAVAVDGAGHIYIVDSGNNRIRRVDGETGLITTVAGTDAGGYDESGRPLGGYSGDGGPATQAQLDNPSDVAVDALGHLYIADTGNNRVRRVDRITGFITTLAGSGAGPGGDESGQGGPPAQTRLHVPVAVAVDQALNLYIAEINGHIRKVVFDAEGNPLALPGDFDGDGSVTLADFFPFADGFGGGDPRYDLDGNGAVDLEDFFLFADHFGARTGAKP